MMNMARELCREIVVGIERKKRLNTQKRLMILTFILSGNEKKDFFNARELGRISALRHFASTFFLIGIFE